MKNNKYQIPIALVMLTAVIFMVCLLSSIIVTRWISDKNDQQVDDKVRELSETLSAGIHRHLSQYQFGLRGARGQALTARDLPRSRELFLQYSLSRDIDREFPGALGFGFIRRVPLSEIDRFTHEMIADDVPNFNVLSLGQVQNERWIVQYVEPLARNRKAIGLDINTETKRRAAAMAALKTGETVLTAPIELVQTADTQTGMLMLLPVYQTGYTPDTESERMKNGIGWTFVSLQIQDVLKGFGININQIHLELSDVTEANNAIKFYETEQESPLQPELRTHYREKMLFGRTWMFKLAVHPEFVASLHQTDTKIVAVMGAVFSVVFSLMIGGLLVSRSRKRQISNERARVAAIVENSTDCIYLQDVNGVITDWHLGAERVFGLSAQEAVGRKAVELIVPKDREKEETSLLGKVLGGELIANYSSVRLTKSGQYLDVSIAQVPIYDHHQKVIDVATIIRDVSAQKAVEKKHYETIIAINSSLEVQVKERTRALEQAHQRIRALVDAIPAMIGYWNSDLTLAVANDAYLRSFRGEHSDVIGKSMQELLEADEFQTEKAYADKALAGATQSLERNWFNKSKNEHQYLHTQFIPDIQEGNVVGVYVVNHDITELKRNTVRLQQALNENEALLQTIDQQMLYSVTDLLGVIKEVNPNFCAAVGCRRQDLIGKKLRKIFASERNKAQWREMLSNIRSGLVWSGEIELHQGDDSIRWLHCVVSPFKDAYAKDTGYISLCTDATDRKRLEIKREQLTSLLTSVLDASTEIAIIATDVDGMITVFNRGAERLLGYSAGDLVHKCSPRVFHLPEEVMARAQELSVEYGCSIEGFQTFVHKASLEGSETRQWTYVRRDGQELQVSLSVTAIRATDGSISGYLGVAVDLTTFLAQTRQLSAIRDQLDIAATVAKLGVWSWDVSSNALEWNERMYEIYEQPISLRGGALVYEHWRERVHPEDEAATVASLMAAVEGTGVYNPVFRINTPSGATKFIEAAAQIERNEDGSALRVTGINLDVTDRILLQQHLRNAKEQADAASEAKSSFLANMSHEIRTPLNAVIGMLQLVGHTRLTSRQEDYVSKASGAAKSLLALLNDILDYSKIEAGKLELDLHSFDLERMLLDLAVVLSGAHANKDIEVIYDCDPSLPRTVHGDRLRLQQVLINLAGNAIKFTQKGHVIVAIRATHRSKGQIRLHISVSDTGIGISPSQCEKLFQGFTQAEATTTRKYGGSGLGLVISKRLVELMGATLNVESALGVGSRFWFDLSLQVIDELPIIVACDSEQTPCRLLVVDDNPMVGEILVSAIVSLGWRADYAGSGPVAIERASEAAKLNTPYDVILMDWRMPEMDGIETARQLHQIMEQKARPIVVMVTAYGREFILNHAQDNSVEFAEFLTKPITPLQIKKTVDKILRPLSGQAKDASTDQKSRLQSAMRLADMAILLVEDNKLNREVATELLQMEGATVDFAEGGVEGVQKICSGSRVYDVVLMDIQMPDIDGYEATRRVRADERFQSIPIIAMTANASLQDKERCLEAGMNAHIAKPFDIQEVVNVILRHTGSPAAMHQDNGGEQVRTPVPGVSSQLLDPLHEIMSRFGGNHATYRRMAELFNNEIANQLNSLVSALEVNDRNRAALHMHSIKGIASTMGARQLADTASAIELQIRAEDSAKLSDIITAECLQRLERLTLASHEALQTYLNGIPAQVTDKQEGREPAPLSSLELRQKLTPILPMLRDDNLTAIDAFKKVFECMPSHQQKQFHQLNEYICSLKFELAYQAVNQLLQEA